MRSNKGVLLAKQHLHPCRLIEQTRLWSVRRDRQQDQLFCHRAFGCQDFVYSRLACSRPWSSGKEEKKKSEGTNKEMQNTVQGATYTLDSDR